MRRLISFALFAVLLLLVILPPGLSASAQTYSFSLDWEVVDVYWEADGTTRITYEMVFSNDLAASPMDFIDIGMPTRSFDLGAIRATIDGNAISHIAHSEFVDQAIELGLGSQAIAPGATAVVVVDIPVVRNMLRRADLEGYASGLFAPSWFSPDFVHGTTNLTVRFHLPPGIQSEEPRWHASPGNWPQEAPDTGLDEDGRVLYTWHHPAASPSRGYTFGASFPSNYVPEETVIAPTVSERVGISKDTLISLGCCGAFGLFLLLISYSAIANARSKQLAYLPPKISIEGHGIKRGLTAVEAAILLETKLDKVMTMILFGLIKKGAARVTAETPLTIAESETRPEGLHAYEGQFLDAMKKPAGRQRDKALQELMISLVKSVQKNMKGFSLKETKAYYQSIIAKAWKQVEDADTPQVKSERYAEEVEWTMLDRDFEDRTRRTFRSGPVFLPTWWGAYRPTYHPPAVGGGKVSVPASRTSAGPAGQLSLPSLPGGEFAASMVRGVQNAAGGLIGNLTTFTSGVTKTTNPPPPPPKTSGRPGGGSRSSGGSSCACACACACAGCACACAGGGR